MIGFLERLSIENKTYKLLMALRKTQVQKIAFKNSRNLEIFVLLYFHVEKRPKNGQTTMEKLVVSAAECSAVTIKLN
jgi:hypothetical protein